MAVPPFRIHNNSNSILYAPLSITSIYSHLLFDEEGAKYAKDVKGNSLDLLDNVRAFNLVQEQIATHSTVGPKQALNIRQV